MATNCKQFGDNSHTKPSLAILKFQDKLENHNASGHDDSRDDLSISRRNLMCYDSLTVEITRLEYGTLGTIWQAKYVKISTQVGYIYIYQVLALG